MNLSELKLGKEDRGVIVGQVGSGKSRLARELLPRTGRLAIIDPKRMFDYDIPIFDNARAIWRSKPERFMYRPKPAALSDLHELSEVYRYCYEQGKIFVYTDDVVGIIPRSTPPKFLQVCYQMGRQRQVACLTCCQRPAWLPGFLMTECQKFYAFRVMKKDDLKTLEEYMPGYAGKGWFDNRHVFYYYDVTKYDELSTPVHLNLHE